MSAEEFLKATGDYLSEQLVTDVLAAGEFSAFADESTNEGDRSNMAVFICFVNVTSHKVQERFLGVVKLAKSKKAEDLHDIIMKLLEAKGLDSSLIRFSGLDGTNAMSGERKGLQWLIRHASPYAQYLNCKNYRLVLCLVHLIPKYQKMTELVSLLISLWKTFKYSSIKQSIFQEAQMHALGDGLLITSLAYELSQGSNLFLMHWIVYSWKEVMQKLKRLETSFFSQR